MNALSAMLRWLCSVVMFLPRWALSKVLKKRPSVYRVVRVSDLPDRLKPLTLYLAGDDGQLWGAAMICPCGCGDAIELNLLTQAHPCWSVEPHADGAVTLTPSVWRQKGCKSHFFVRQGRIEWCS